MGVEAIVEALAKNGQVSQLRIARNDAKGSDNNNAVVDAFVLLLNKNRRLRALSIAGNPIGDRGMRQARGRALRRLGPRGDGI